MAPDSRKFFTSLDLGTLEDRSVPSTVTADAALVRTVATEQTNVASEVDQIFVGTGTAVDFATGATIEVKPPVPRKQEVKATDKPSIAAIQLPPVFSQPVAVNTPLPNQSGAVVLKDLDAAARKQFDLDQERDRQLSEAARVAQKPKEQQPLKIDSPRDHQTWNDPFLLNDGLLERGQRTRVNGWDSSKLESGPKGAGKDSIGGGGGGIGGGQGAEEGRSVVPPKFEAPVLPRRQEQEVPPVPPVPQAEQPMPMPNVAPLPRDGKNITGSTDPVPARNEVEQAGVTTITSHAEMTARDDNTVYTVIGGVLVAVAASVALDKRNYRKSEEARTGSPTNVVAS